MLQKKETKYWYLIIGPPSLFISYSYPNKEKRDAPSGIVITCREVIRVLRREKLYIFMKHVDFEEHKLHCVQRWVRVIR